MKRKILTIALVAALAMTLVLCASCVKGQEALNELQQTYSKVSEATKIQIKIENRSNKLLQYSSDTVYTKTGSGYSWTKTTKTINKIDNDTKEPYATETTTGSESSASSFVPALKLDEQYFVTGYDAGKDHLNANVKAGSEQNVLGYSGSLLSSISDLSITMQVDKSHVTNLGITFVSDNINVTITVSFTY